jgi:hypothetical protein
MYANTSEYAWKMNMHVMYVYIYIDEWLPYMCISHENAGLLVDTNTANTSEYACSVSLYIINVHIHMNARYRYYRYKWICM